MDWKSVNDFLRPNYQKLLIFFVLAFLFSTLIDLAFSYFLLYLLQPGYLTQRIINLVFLNEGTSPSNFFAYVLLLLDIGLTTTITLIWWYFLSCLIFYIYVHIVKGNLKIRKRWAI